MTNRWLPVAALACAACTPIAESHAPDASPPSGAQCDATRIQDLVGRRGDPSAVADARKRSGSRTVRRYVTGSALTMDFRPDRLNVEVSARGAIVKLSCG